MLALVDEPWPCLAQLCADHAAERIDILTGYIGSGATQALTALGVRARIVIGLPREDAPLSAAQVTELRALLAAQHEVRWVMGLHAKLYVVAQRAVLVGSANFTRAGFEQLDELGVVTDDPAVVAGAVAAFEERFARATPLDPDRLHVMEASGDGDSLAHDLGRAWTEADSGFSQRSLAAGPRSQLPAPATSSRAMMLAWS